MFTILATIFVVLANSGEPPFVAGVGTKAPPWYDSMADCEAAIPAERLIVMAQVAKHLNEAGKVDHIDMACQPAPKPADDGSI